MEQKKNNGINANIKKSLLPDSKIKLPTPKTERHIFTLDVKFSVVAPPDVDQKTLTDKIDALVDTYLHENYAVSNIEIPGSPGMPQAGTIIELKHKAK